MTIAGNPFTLTRVGGGAAGLVMGTPTLDGQGRTVVTFTFSGAETDPLTGSMPSLADGRFQLAIADGAITLAGSGLALDGDGNGTAGGAYLSPYDTAGGGTGQLHLFRLFGDVTGDGFVAAQDFNQFQLAFGTEQGIDLNYNAAFDINGDGFIAAQDFNQFKTRFGTSVFDG